MGSFHDGQLEPVFGFGVAAGDFNHDGNLDVASTQAYPSYNPNGVSILLGNGDGTFQAAEPYSGLEEPLGITTGDFNGDQELDLAVTDYIFNTVVILQGNGDGTFTNTGQWFAGINPGSVAVSDFNGDGKADLAVSDFGDNAVVVLPGQGDGRFPSLMKLRTGASPASVVAIDVNQDGSADLVSVNNGDETFSVLLNTAGTYVQLRSSLNPSSSGQPVTFTMKVHGSVITSSLPTGSVVFKDRATTLGSAPLAGGVASFTTSSLGIGSHFISAVYSGDSNFNPHRSTVLVQTVQ